MPSHLLTKSDFKNFLKCSCYLWLCKQRQDLLPEQSDDLKRILDEGNEVDEAAKSLYPGALEVQGYNEEGWRNTRSALKSGAKVLLQPTAIYNKITCRLDILTWNERTNAWDIREVKSSTSVKEEYIMELAFQRICFEGAGVKIGKTYLVHLNRGYVRRGDINIKKLLVAEDVTKEVNKILDTARVQIKEALKVCSLGPKVHPNLVARCGDPSKCDYLPCYWDEIPKKDKYSIAENVDERRLIKLLKSGLLKLSYLPPNRHADFAKYVPKKPIKNPKPMIDVPALRRMLNQLKYPLCFFDYEAWYPAIPKFDGIRPYDHVVFQYSLDIIRKPGSKLEHTEFLFDRYADPTKTLADTLKRDMPKKGSVIVWNASYESTRNEEMGMRLPKFKSFFKNVNARMFDLMLPFSKGLYERAEFEGSSKLKVILPIMAPDCSYKKLKIREGGAASASWPELTLKNQSNKKREKLRQDMLKYCALDTYGLTRILEELKKAVVTKNPFK